MVIAYNADESLRNLHFLTKFAIEDGQLNKKNQEKCFFTKHI